MKCNQKWTQETVQVIINKMALPKLLQGYKLHSHSPLYGFTCSYRNPIPAVFILKASSKDEGLNVSIAEQLTGRFTSLNLFSRNLLFLLCFNLSVLIFLEHLGKVIFVFVSYLISHKITILTLNSLLSLWVGKYQQTICLDIRNDKDKAFPCASCIILSLKQYFWSAHKIALIIAKIYRFNNMTQ